MNATPFVIVAFLVLFLGYRFYISFVAAKLATINDLNKTPSSRFYDGQNFVPTNKWVLFGHHFAAIAGAGPLVGPVLAAQFGFFPGFIWMLVGSVFAGAVHDFVILYASTKLDGKSLSEIARTQINKVSGFTASVATLIILVIAMAGLGLVVVNALTESSWGVFTISSTIPIAIVMGIWMFKINKGKVLIPTIFGVILLALAVIYGKYIPDSSIAGWFILDHKALTIALICYGFIASVLPVWLLLSPRDYLSSIMKIVVVAMLALGVIIVSPTLHMPAFTQFIHGGGPVIPGSLFPYLFITIACGAISGFHALVSSGTTPKMIMKESHIKGIAAGSMLIEAGVSILALIAASSLFPLDYFAINVPVEKFNAILPQLQAMGFTETNLTQLSKDVGETIQGRTGGAVSLGVGMAQIFASLPGLSSFLSYWYHFAIMFEALFILTTIDAGTRIGRFIIQEMIGKVYPPFARTNWLPANIISSFIIVLSWGYFIYTGSVSTIWPMFGTANQLLASIALAVGTTYIINNGRIKWAWITIVPFMFIGVTTLYAAFMNIINIYIPQMLVAESFVKGLINVTLSSVIVTCALVIFFNSIPLWYKKYIEFKKNQLRDVVE